MFKIPEGIFRQRSEYIQTFEKHLQENSPKISQFDRDQLQKKAEAIIDNTKNAVAYGGLTSLFIAWNFRNITTLSNTFKIFAFLTPIIWFPSYTYFSQINKAYAYHTLLAVKYKDLLYETKADEN